MGKPEGTVEKHFCKQCRKNAILALKLESDGRSGFPDRTCFHFPGQVFFAELKAEKEEARLRQSFWHRLLRQLGFKVYVIDTKEKADKAIKAELERARLSKRMRKKGARTKVPRLLSRSRSG